MHSATSGSPAKESCNASQWTLARPLRIAAKSSHLPAPSSPCDRRQINPPTVKNPIGPATPPSLLLPPTAGPPHTPQGPPHPVSAAMKRRITLIHRPEDGIDPGSVRIEKGAISGPELRAAREERLTFIPDELPEDVLALLSRCAGRLHVRWATSSSYEAPELLSSRISPGLHVFYTPPGNSKDEP